MFKWDWRSCCCCHLLGTGSHLPISPPLPPPSCSPPPLVSAAFPGDRSLSPSSSSLTNNYCKLSNIPLHGFLITSCPQGMRLSHTGRNGPESRASNRPLESLGWCGFRLRDGSSCSMHTAGLAQAACKPLDDSAALGMGTCNVPLCLGRRGLGPARAGVESCSCRTTRCAATLAEEASSRTTFVYTVF